MLLHGIVGNQLAILVVLAGTQPEDYIGEGDEMERNPAYQTSASLIPSSSSNPSYAGLNITANVYEDVPARPGAPALSLAS